jgi:hypothetical protein
MSNNTNAGSIITPSYPAWFRYRLIKLKIYYI